MKPALLTASRSHVTLFYAVLLLAVLSGCAAYVPGRQSYWDARLKDMCEADGGVTIFETISISKEDFQNLRKVGGYASIPPRSSANAADILFWDEAVTVLHGANPRVWRSEQLIKRKSDESVVAKVVRYSRVGGDIPSIAHESQFGCPEEKEIFARREKLFVVPADGR